MERPDGFRCLNNDKDAVLHGDDPFTWRLLFGRIGSEVSEITVVFEDSTSFPGDGGREDCCGHPARRAFFSVHLSLEEAAELGRMLGHPRSDAQS